MTRRRLAALLLAALGLLLFWGDARALGSSPLLVRLGLQDPPRAASGRPLEPPATAEEMAQGAPYRPHAVDEVDYYDLRFHPLALAAAALLAGAAFLALGGSPAPTRRVGAALAAALLFLALLEGTTAELVPRPGPYVHDPRFLWRLRANLRPRPPIFHHTDADGYRWLPPGDEGAPAILVLGDSTSYGIGVEDEANLYSRVLRDRLPGAPRVVNRAIPGYSSWQGLLTLRHERERLHPKAVVAAFMANDWTSASLEDRRAAPEGRTQEVRAFWLHSHLYLALRKALLPWLAGAGGAPATRVPVDQYRDNLRAMAASCRADGARLILVNLPMAPLLDRVSEPYRAEVLAMRGEPGVTVLDLHTQARGVPGWEGWFAPDDPLHPGDEGHLWVGEHLLPAVREALP